MSPIAKLSASGAINDISFQKLDNNVAWTVGESKAVQSWDVRKSDGPSQERENAHDDEMMCVDTHPTKQHLLLTGGADNAIKLWDARNLKTFVHSMEGVHTDDVTSVRWSPNHDSFFMSAGSDRRVNVWDLGRIGAEQTEEDATDDEEVPSESAGHKV